MGSKFEWMKEVFTVFNVFKIDHLWIMLTSQPDSNNETDSFVNKDINY